MNIDVPELHLRFATEKPGRSYEVGAHGEALAVDLVGEDS